MIIAFVFFGKKTDGIDEGRPLAVQTVSETSLSFVTCMIPDGNDGVWIGTQKRGLHHYDPTTKKTVSYDTKNGLSDNGIVSLAIDRQGRLWAGTQQHGVCVFNGKEWKNFDVFEGMPGEHVFDIQICPADGDIWLATSGGLIRYQDKGKKWLLYTRLEGLPEFGIHSLAFDRDSHLYLGTQCHGIAVLKRSSGGNYAVSQKVTAPRRFGPENESPVPLVPCGKGLPSNGINQIHIGGTGTIWVATASGLAWSRDEGKTWQFLRGRNYGDKMRGLLHGTPKNWTEIPKPHFAMLLPEDMITSVTEDANGALWIGTRTSGVIALDPAFLRPIDEMKTDDVADSNRVIADMMSLELPKRFFGLKGHAITGIVPTDSGQPLIASYLDGLQKTKKKVKVSSETASAANAMTLVSNAVAFESPAGLPNDLESPNLEELRKQIASIQESQEKQTYPYAAFASEDWKTQGNWMGGYGRRHAVLCGAAAPFDQKYIFDESLVKIHPFTGDCGKATQPVNRELFAKDTKDFRAPFFPKTAGRCLAGWTDCGESYPQGFDGPDLWLLVELKEPGAYRMNMYFLDKDAQQDVTKIHDHIVEVYPTNESWQDSSQWREQSELATELSRTESPLWQTRVTDFWSGVHKQLLLVGPGNYYIKVDRSDSVNTTLSAVMIDPLQETPSFLDSLGLAGLNVEQHQTAHKLPELPKSQKDEKSKLAAELWKAVEENIDQTMVLANYQTLRMQAFQAAKQGAKSSSVAADVKLRDALAWRLNLWPKEQTKQWETFFQSVSKRSTAKNEAIQVNQ